VTEPLSIEALGGDAKEAPPLSPDAQLRAARQELLNQIDVLHPATFGDNLRLAEAIESLINAKLRALK
jgi:hypothetical protein